MSVQIQRNELPPDVRESVAQGILSGIGDPAGIWLVKMTSEKTAYAWDIEVQGPNGFHWARRFSAEDRDAEVISEAIRSAVLESA
jgi:hypothetical protein